MFWKQRQLSKFIWVYWAVASGAICFRNGIMKLGGGRNIWSQDVLKTALVFCSHVNLFEQIMQLPQISFKFHELFHDERYHNIHYVLQYAGLKWLAEVLQTGSEPEGAGALSAEDKRQVLRRIWRASVAEGVVDSGQEGWSGLWTTVWIANLHQALLTMQDCIIHMPTDNFNANKYHVTHYILAFKSIDHKEFTVKFH